MSHLLLTLALCLGVDPAPAPLRVVIVTGVDHPAHNWKLTGPVLRDILAKDPKLDVRLVEDPEFLASDLLLDYDVLVLHFRNEKPLKHEDAARAHLKKFIEAGKGLVVVHFACGAFPDWPGYRDLVGRVWDGVNTHDPRGPFDVHVLASDDPVLGGQGDFRTDDELYIGLTGERPVRVLADARSKVTGRDHPMAFTFAIGEARVFHTPLGHDVKALQVPEVSRLLTRGTLWAGGLSP